MVSAQAFSYRPRLLVEFTGLVASTGSILTRSYRQTVDDCPWVEQSLLPTLSQLNDLSVTLVAKAGLQVWGKVVVQWCSDRAVLANNTGM